MHVKMLASKVWHGYLSDYQKKLKNNERLVKYENYYKKTKNKRIIFSKKHH